MIASILAFSLAVGGANLTLAADAAAASQSDQQIKERFEKEIEANPAIKSVYVVMQRTFPTEYDAFLKDLASNLRNNIGKDAAYRSGFDFMRSLIARNLTNISKAPTDKLLDYAAANAKLVSALQNSRVDLCAKFGMTGLGANDRVPEHLYPVMARVTATSLEAARAGIDAPVDRNYKEIAEEDAVAWVEKMAEIGAAPETIELIAAEDGLTKASVEDQCKASVIIYSAITELDAETGANIIAFIAAQAD